MKISSLLFCQSFTPATIAESIDSFFLLLKKTLATARLQKRRPIDSCMVHGY